MSLLCNSYVQRREDPLSSRIWKGKVVDNQDPLEIQRVKIEVIGRLEGSTDLLPWALKQNGNHLGGGPMMASISIPQVGTYVTVTFQNGLYAPIYTGYWEDEDTKFGSTGGDGADNKTELAGENYGEVFGYTDPSGNRWKVNFNTELTEFVHSSGSLIRFNKDGDVTVESRRDTIQKIDRDWIVDVGRDLVHNIVNDSTTDVGNNEALSVAADRSASVGGSDSEAVTGEQSVTVSGSQSTNVTGVLSMQSSASAILKASGALTLKGRVIREN